MKTLNSGDPLAGRHILIVEDEWLLADHLDGIVTDAGGSVIGPFATAQQALDALDHGRPRPDAATLNVVLMDHMSFDVADRLGAIGVPYSFLSANRPYTLPERFQTMPLLAKPFSDVQVVAALVALLTPAEPAPTRTVG
ncbi:response regulator [Sphingomonas melonis]|uniref:DNA-binding response OmpR family regulator n=1 Tax=Sphingomonas melonis TaxID=152682 RepID=A0A7Y9K4D8_9SPHN|nr:response regulator [Sphingomonas melonis]NYD91879.1 DNA-binding response OmpR family regulator [Sphingomonas melonis]